MGPLRLCAWLYWPALLAMVLWVFIWPLMISPDPDQPGLWRWIVITLVAFMLALLARVVNRARQTLG